MDELLQPIMNVIMCSRYHYFKSHTQQADVSVSWRLHWWIEIEMQESLQDTHT